MPHQCTQCGHTFPDGSKEMLSGCPDCGGNKFQFKPAADTTTGTGTAGASDAAPESPSSPSVEDPAQSDASREVASGDDRAHVPSDDPDSTGNEGVPDPEPNTDAGRGSSSEPEGSDMAALRAELDDQFESIKILEPGQYELNLMELYNREEYIVALQEDGQYVIEVPETWLGTDDS